MGKGAPVKHSNIPTKMIVEIFAWEGLLYEAQRKMAEVLRSILDGSNEDWDSLDSYRKQSIQYSQEYTKAILRLQFSQMKG